MKPTPTDLDLVRGLHARSAAAFARVYNDHHAGIYNLCARILDDREEARDVTQDVFITAFSRPPVAIGEVKLRAWLYRVATNACFNVARRHRPSGDLIETDDLPATNDGYEQARSVALIEESLGRLNERYRAALVLKDLHGLDGEELAAVLEVSRPAADVLVHRARASFKKAFAGLAGEGFAAPANLALTLPALTVPAALQALPSLPTTLAPPHMTVAPSPAAPGLDPSSVIGPAGTGLLAKLAATAGTKAAIVVGSAAIIAGGGLAVHEAQRDDRPASRTGDAAPAISSAAHEQGGAHHDAHGGSHESGEAHRLAVAERAHHSAHHSGAGAHSDGPHGGQAPNTGGQGSFADAAHSGDSHQAATVPAASTTTVPAHHSDSGDASDPHTGDAEH